MNGVWDRKARRIWGWILCCGQKPLGPHNICKKGNYPNWWKCWVFSDRWIHYRRILNMQKECKVDYTVRSGTGHFHREYVILIFNVSVPQFPSIQDMPLKQRRTVKWSLDLSIQWRGRKFFSKNLFKRNKRTLLCFSSSPAMKMCYENNECFPLLIKQHYNVIFQNSLGVKYLTKLKIHLCPSREYLII